MFDSLNGMNSKRQKESGNALIYVLIAIALFAALSMTLGRQTDTSEANSISDGKAELYASQLINYTAQVKLVMDQMIITGNADTINNMIFSLPTAGSFNAGSSHIYKVYHPEGGGLNPANIPAGAIAQISTDPPAGWYLGRNNNVEWTSTTGDDVILVAHQISQKVCEKINLKVTGTTAIPALGDDGDVYFIDDSLHTGTNADFDLAECGGCLKYASLCALGANNAYEFYTVVADQ